MHAKYLNCTGVLPCIHNWNICYVLLSTFEIWTTFPTCMSESFVASVGTGIMPVRSLTLQ